MRYTNGDRENPNSDRKNRTAVQPHSRSETAAIVGDMVAQEKNFSQQNQKILSTMNPGKLRVSNEGLCNHYQLI